MQIIVDIYLLAHSDALIFASRDTYLLISSYQYIDMGISLKHAGSYFVAGD